VKSGERWGQRMSPPFHIHAPRWQPSGGRNWESYNTKWTSAQFNISFHSEMFYFVTI
jgi:hypothetical protein